LPEALYSWLKLCDRYFPSALFNADSGAPLLSAQKLFLPTVQHDLLIQFFLLLEGICFPKPLFHLQHKFWSRRLGCLWLLSGYSEFILSSQCHIHISIHSHCSGHPSSSLMSYLTVFYIVSAKKFGIFERKLKFNLYIHVQNYNDTFTNPLTSDSYTERLRLIFLK